jgi:signal-transduction protein with cAMP-binding, CBS, and nucleotidyltransferase domain
MKVRDIMSETPVLIREDAPLEQVARAMLERGSGTAVVVGADGKLRGVVTEDDFVVKDRYLPFSTECLPQLFGRLASEGELEQAYGRAARELTARQVMHKPAALIGEDEPAVRAIQRLSCNGLDHLPVVRQGVPVGVVERRDLLRLMVRRPS